MKEFIFINYNLIIDKIYKDYFFINDEKIKIIKYKEDINKIDKLVHISNELYKNKLFVDTFILNKEGKFITKNNKENIILLKVNDRDKLIDINYLKKFRIINNLEKENIKEKWIKEVDEFENKIIEYNMENKLIQNSSNYFIGLAENAIALINEYEITNEIIGHNINFYKINKSEFNNPLTFIKIDKMYDMSNYIKIKFYRNELSLDEIDTILAEMNDESQEAKLFSYLLYPNYYFDLISENFDEKRLHQIVKKIKKYEKMLVYVKEKTKKCKKIKLFVWLK